jgi:Tfp pilus assembly major pilin PilA
MMATKPSQQRGMSLISGAIVLIVVAILGTAAFRMIPAYMEHNTISTAIRSLLQDSKTALMSPREIRDGLSKRFTINQVNVISVDDLVIVKKGGVLTVSTDYEVREPLFYNVSIVMSFNDEFKKDIRQ